MLEKGDGSEESPPLGSRKHSHLAEGGNAMGRDNMAPKDLEIRVELKGRREAGKALKEGEGITRKCQRNIMRLL